MLLTMEQEQIEQELKLASDFPIIDYYDGKKDLNTMAEALSGIGEDIMTGAAVLNIMTDQPAVCNALISYYGQDFAKQLIVFDNEELSIDAFKQVLNGTLEFEDIFYDVYPNAKALIADLMVRESLWDIEDRDNHWNELLESLFDSFDNYGLPELKLTRSLAKLMQTSDDQVCN